MIFKLKIVLVVAPSTLILSFMALTIIYLLFYFNKRYSNMRKKLQLLEDEKQSEISRIISETREEERNKIASDLHDSIGAELSILKLKLSRYGFYLKNNLLIKSDSFIKDIDQLDDTINYVRTVCKELYTESLDANGLTKSCEKFTNNLNSTGFIKSEFKTHIRENEWQMSAETRNIVFMVFQEMMNNVIKHANCTEIRIMVYSTSRNEIIVTCRHNGIRFENKDLKQMLLQNKGIGLKCMCKRMQLFGGKINYLRQGNESVVNLHVPAKRLSESKQGLPLAKYKRNTKHRYQINQNLSGNHI